jgi:D-alanine-D-alanine ligase
MGKYDCIVLYNKIEDYPPAFDDRFLSDANVRDEVFAVEEALRELGYNPYLFEIERIDKETMSLIWKLSPKFVFNLCEGLYARSDLEMCVAGLLELLGFAYTGSPPFSLGLALNKNKVKQILMAAGVPTPQHWVINEVAEIQSTPVTFPVIVKPSREDASIGICADSVVCDLDQLQRQVEFVLCRYQQPALVEQYIDGRELNVSILGHGEPVVLPISEIDFSNLPPDEPKIVTYKAKWDPSSPQYQGTVPVCPARLGPKTAARVKEIALRAFNEIHCRDYARVDLRMDAKNNPYVLEVNPNPDISPEAGLARSARMAGINYTELIGRIVEFTRSRGTKETRFEYAS